MYSNVTFFKDCGFDRRHANVRDFASRSAQLAWFESRTAQANWLANYDKVQNAIKMEIPYEDAVQYSYLAVDYGADLGFRDYCFIDSVEIVNDTTVRFRVTVDPWQTYMFKPDGSKGWELERSFVVRAHLDRWKPDADTPSMSIYPREGIDGYQEVTAVSEIAFQVMDDDLQPIPGYHWMFVFLAMTVSKKIGDESVRTNVGYFIVPCIKEDYDMKVYWGQGTEHPFPTLNELMEGDFVEQLGIDPTTIMSMGIAPFAGFQPTSCTKDASGIHIAAFNPYGYTELRLARMTPSSTRYLLSPAFKENTRPENPMVWALFTSGAPTKPTRPAGGWASLKENAGFEPMYYLSPVRTVSLYSPSGSKLLDIPDSALLKGNGSIKIGVSGVPSASGYTYRLVVGGLVDGVDEGESPYPAYDAVGCACECPDDKLDIATNDWQTYVTTQMDTTRKLNNAKMAATATKGVANTVANLFNPLNWGSILTDATSTVVDTTMIEATERLNEQGIRNQSAGLLSSGVGTGLLYTTSILPQLVTTYADEATRQAFIRKIVYQGYSVNRYWTVDIRSRYVFNYVQTVGAVVRGDMPEDRRQEIADIFNAGVTIWHDDFEYDTDTANVERSLVDADPDTGA